MNDYVHQISEAESARIRRFVRGFALVAVAFVVLVILAIVFADRWMILISSASEKRFVQPYIEWADDHVLQRSDPDLQAYVDDLARRLSDGMNLDEDLQLEFRVVKGSTVNAFTMLGGNIYLFEGLISALDNENALSMALAHEIAHARHRDPLLGAGRGILLQLLLSSISGGGIDPSTIDTGSNLMLNTYSREQEEAADRVALAALQQRYGHVGGATQLFEILRISDNVPESMEILASHPQLERRIAYLDAMSFEHGWVAQPTIPYPGRIQALLNYQP